MCFVNMWVHNKKKKLDLHKILKFQSISYILLLLHHLYKYI